MSLTTQHRHKHRHGRPRSGAVFDCDGTLVDTSAHWRVAFDAGAQRCGITLDEAQHRALIGSSPETAAQRLHELATTDPSLSSLVHTIHTTLRASLHQRPPEPLPGAHELLTMLHRAVPLAVASNAPRETLVDVLALTGLSGFFEHIVSAQDTNNAKPAPDVYLEACARLAIDPTTSLAVEDSPLGARSARAAGLIVALVAPGDTAADDAALTVDRLDDQRLLAFLHDHAALAGWVL